MNSLTDFQTNLTAALRQSQAGGQLFVAITLDDDRWLIDLAAIQEASVPPRVARSSGAPSWVLGIGNFKGKVWSVLDMRVLLHDQKTFNPQWGWVTLLRPVNGHEVALLWSEIVEIAPQSAYTRVTPEQSDHPWSKSQWKDKEGNLWKEFDVLKLMGETGLIGQWIASTDRLTPEGKPLSQTDNNKNIQKIEGVE